MNQVFYVMGGIHGTIKELYGEAPDLDRYDVARFQAINASIDALRRADILASPCFCRFNDGVQRGMTDE